MPSGPTVIPGVYGFGDDLAQALRDIGQGLGTIAIGDKLKVRQAMEQLADPVYAEGVAKRREAAYAKQEAVDKEREQVIRLQKEGLATQEDVNKFVDPIGKHIIDSQRAEMFAVGLDPDNPRHQAMAIPVFEAARSALPADTRAQVRLGNAPQAVENLVEAGKRETEAQRTYQGITAEALKLRAQLGTDLEQQYTELYSTQLTRAARELDLKFQDPEFLESVIMEDETLRALAATTDGGIDAVREALLMAYKASLSPEGFEALDLSDKIQLAAAVETATNRYLELVQQAASTDDETEAMILLSNALSGYEAHREQLAPYSREMARTKFPVIPITYTKGKFFKKKGVRLITWMPPEDWGKSPTEYAEWLTGIEYYYNQVGKDKTAELLKEDEYFQDLSEEGRRFALTQLHSAGISLPELGDILTEEDLKEEAEGKGKEIGLTEGPLAYLFRRFFEGVEARTTGAGVVVPSPRR